MNFTVRQKLKDIIHTYGISICKEPNRIKSLLKDYCNENKREIFLILSALNENIVSELQNIDQTLVQLGVVNRLTKRLCYDLGISEENAKWVVETWMYALDITNEVVIQEFENKNKSIYDTDIKENEKKLYSLKRDIFETYECFNNRIKNMNFIEVGKIKILKESYDISTGIFKVEVIWDSQITENVLTTNGMYLYADVEMARYLYGLDKEYTLYSKLDVLCGEVLFVTKSLIRVNEKEIELYSEGNITTTMCTERYYEGDYLNSFAISPNGRYLASGDTKGKIHVYELLSGKEIAVFNHQGEISSLQFSPDSRILLSATDDKTKYQKKLFSDEEYPVVITLSDKVIRLWDIAQKIEYKSLRGHECAIRKAIFAGNGRFIVSKGLSITRNDVIWEGVKIWDTINGTIINSKKIMSEYKSYKKLHFDEHIDDIHYYAEGNCIYILGSHNNTVKFKLNAGEIIEENTINGIGGYGWEFCDKYIYKVDYKSSSKQFSMKIIDLISMEEKQVGEFKFEYRPYGHKISHDGRLLVSILASYDPNRIIKIIDIDKNEIIKTINDGIVRLVQFSADNKMIYLITQNRDNCELLFKVVPIFD